MNYVTSDLHGISLQELQTLLNRAGFTQEDFLYILGDVIDRGRYGAELLLWITQQPNVELILGNHEALMLACSFLFDEVTEDSLNALSPQKLALAENWMQNGGGSTMKGFQKLLKQDGELTAGILDYLQDCPLYEAVEVNGRVFVLVHAGLGNFHPARKLWEYTPEELMMTRPTLDTAYFANAIVIFGHTPTAVYGAQYTNRALHTKTWICIDTGASMGGKPMLLRLEDLAEFYLT